MFSFLQKPVQYPQGLTDIHTHLVPYVDDGAQNLAEALDLLRLQAAQGVSAVFCTVHQRQGMFETPQPQVNKQFARLRAEAAAIPNAPRLYLGRENHCDDAFINLLRAGTAQTLGGSRYLLLEFGGAHPGKLMTGMCQALLRRDIIPVVAHVERYRALYHEPGLAQSLAQCGALLQVNAGSVLGEDGATPQKLCEQLLQQNLVSFVASDAHNTLNRLPNLGKCAAQLSKTLPPAQFEAIFYQNPAKLLASAAQTAAR